jgi:hypothetical protein
MSDNGMGKISQIIDPLARDILTLTISDRGQVHLESQLPPVEVTKLLNNLIAELIFKRIEQLEETIKRRV